LNNLKTFNITPKIDAKLIITIDNQKTTLCMEISLLVKYVKVMQILINQDMISKITENI